MNWIVRLGWYFLGQYFKGRMARKLKRQGIIVYLRTLQGSRRVLILALLGFFILQTVMLAGIGVFVSGLFLLDLETHTKLEISFGVFLALFLLPLLVILFALNERVWYRLSGAKKMVDSLQDENSAA